MQSIILERWVELFLFLALGTRVAASELLGDAVQRVDKRFACGDPDVARTAGGRRALVAAYSGFKLARKRMTNQRPQYDNVALHGALKSPTHSF